MCTILITVSDGFLGGGEGAAAAKYSKGMFLNTHDYSNFVRQLPVIFL